MLKRLNTKNGSDVWINKALATEIEFAFKEVLKTDKLYYFYSSCRGNSINTVCSGKHKLVWLGGVGVINLIKKVQSKVFNAPVLYVTSFSNKGALMNSHIDDTEHDNVYWIGDISRDKHVICGDDLFIALWNRIKQHVTRQESREVETKI